MHAAQAYFHHVKLLCWKQGFQFFSQFGISHSGHLAVHAKCIFSPSAHESLWRLNSWPTAHIPFQLPAVARACLVILFLIVEWSFVQFGDDHTTRAMGPRPSLGHLLGVVGLLAVQPKSHRQRRAKSSVFLRQSPAKNPKKERSSFKNVLHTYKTGYHHTT